MSTNGKSVIADQALGALGVEHRPSIGSAKWADECLEIGMGGDKGLQEVPVVKQLGDRNPSSYLAAVQREVEGRFEVQQAGLRSMMENRDWRNGLALSYEEHIGEELVFSEADIASELLFWRNALIGYVLGDVVPFSAMESFV
ncbi:hypothetical protein Dimus_012717 [Dionaea muscipula]